MNRLFLIIACLAALWQLSGCASYTDHIRDAQRELIAQNPTAALDIINDRLKVDSPRYLPGDLEQNNVLLLLERATLLQALGEYELSARDMMIVDQHLDWLDIASGTAESVARYFYSDDITRYRAPAYERLLLNSLNMINFLALGRLEGARVEARRFHIMEQYFLDESERALLPHLLAVGNYLGAVAFERSRDFDTAVRYYSRAWHYGLQSHELHTRLEALIAMTGYRARDLLAQHETSPIESLVQSSRLHSVLTFAEYEEQFLSGDMLIVVQTGLVPYKEATRLPIAEALIYAGAATHSQYHISTQERRRAQEFALHGVLKWLSFPSLVHPHMPRTRNVRLHLNDHYIPNTFDLHITRQVEQFWLHISGNIVAAAITRLITRAVAGQVSRAVVSEVARAQGSSSANALGWLAALAVEGAMTAADTPDTRSWTTLPAQLRLIRVNLAPGEHLLHLEINGMTETQSIRVTDERLNFLNFSRFR